MNAERLIALYERVADAPDAVPRLRQFILDLAVRGKLLPQIATERPERTLLDQVGHHGRTSADLPSNWTVASVGHVLDFQYGKGLPANNRLSEGPVPVFGSNGIMGFTNEPLTDQAAVIVGRKGSAGALQLCDGPSWTTDVAYFVEKPSFMELRYLFLALQGLKLETLGKGVKPGLSRSDAYALDMAVPPLAEQRRIVAKVDELMVLLDQLEAARHAREATRDRLAVAALARLIAPDTPAEEATANARFALNTLPALTTRPDQIKALRQTILNLAIRGKLVEQDPSDETASDLLRRIVAEKNRLAKAGEIRAPKPLPPSDDAPFDVPVNWCWTQLAEIGVISPRNDAPDDLQAAFVPMTMIAAEYGVPNRHEVRPWREIKKGYTHFAEGDVGLAKITPCFENGKSTVFRALAGGIGSGTTELHIVRPIFVFPEYILLFLKSPSFIESGIPKMTGTAGQKRVPSEYFANSPFPLPPLAEQHRIVAKVEALMALCDQLEAALTTANTTRTHLLESLLREALVPEAESAMELA